MYAEHINVRAACLIIIKGVRIGMPALSLRNIETNLARFSLFPCLDIAGCLDLKFDAVLRNQIVGVPLLTALG